MYTLSIVVNFHREGDLARKTINNLRNALAYASLHKNWDNIEIVVVLDNSDLRTKQVILDNQDIIQCYEEVNFGDLALSRNHGVVLAKNNFIMFADGDDYISHNTLHSIYQQFFSHYSKFNCEPNHLVNAQHIAVFPALLVEFPKLLFQQYQNSNNFISANMKFQHCFVSRISCL